MDRQLERVTDPTYLDGLAQRPLPDVRARRAECQEIEQALSYVRRLAQGRLDIVAAELARRASGGDPGDLRDLVDRLPEILADRGERSSGPGRPPVTFSATDRSEGYAALLDAIVSADGIASLADRSDPELVDIRERLVAFENELSGHRHAVHQVIDALQAEVARRYRDGEATVDSLLS